MLKPLAIATTTIASATISERGPLYLYHGPTGYFWAPYMENYTRPVTFVFDAPYTAIQSIRELFWRVTML